MIKIKFSNDKVEYINYVGKVYENKSYIQGEDVHYIVFEFQDGHKKEYKIEKIKEIIIDGHSAFGRFGLI